MKAGFKVKCRKECEVPNPLIPKRPLVLKVGRVAEVLALEEGRARLGWFNFGGLEANGYIDFDPAAFNEHWELHQEAEPTVTGAPRPMILAHHPDQKTNPLKAIGFWAWKLGEGDLPWPGDFIDRSWSQAERATVVAYLKNAPTIEHWMGFSMCRLCGEENGSTDQSDGTYVWPEGFTHYVEHHGVKPAKEFVEHAILRLRGL